MDNWVQSGGLETATIGIGGMTKVSAASMSSFSPEYRGFFGSTFICLGYRTYVQCIGRGK